MGQRAAGEARGRRKDNAGEEEELDKKRQRRTRQKANKKQRRQEKARKTKQATKEDNSWSEVSWKLVEDPTVNEAV